MKTTEKSGRMLWGICLTVLFLLFAKTTVLAQEQQMKTVTGGATIKEAVEVDADTLYATTSAKGWFKLKHKAGSEKAVYLGAGVDEFSTVNLTYNGSENYTFLPYWDYDTNGRGAWGSNACENLIDGGCTKYYMNIPFDTDGYVYFMVSSSKAEHCQFEVVVKYGSEDPEEINMKEEYSIYSHIGKIDFRYKFTASRTGYYLVRTKSGKENKPGYVPSYVLKYADGGEVYPEMDINEDLYSLKKGMTYYLTIEYNHNYCGEYRFSVSNQLVEEIVLNAERLDLKAPAITVSGVEDEDAEVYVLKASVLPADAVYPDIVWESSDPEVASVTKDGRVTAIGYGNAVITASAVDGSGVSKKCEVHVTQDVRVGVRFQSGDLTYKVISAKKGDQKVEVNGLKKKTRTTYTVPDEILFKGNTFAVTKIGDGAFDSCKKLQYVTLGDKLVQIGKYAFRDCKKMEAVYGGEYLTEIGKGAFINCKGLVTFGSKRGAVTLPEVKTIGESAFENCANITKVNIPSKELTEIKKQAFANCEKLKEFSQDSLKLEKIGVKAFYDAESLKKVTLKTKKLAAGKVGNSAFKGIKKKCVFHVPSNKIKLYTKLFIGAGAPSDIKVQK